MSQVSQFHIQGPVLLTLNKYADSRGFFTERYKDDYKKILGLTTNFVQDNFSTSLKNVVRGLHMQHSPGQGKLVTCLHGEILDVVVDIRKGSPTYGQHVTVHLKGDEPALFWIPSGFAHGFSVLSETADVLYKVDCPYNAKNEMSIKWNDADLKIDWKVKEAVVSDKDNASPSFKTYSENPAF